VEVEVAFGYRECVTSRLTDHECGSSWQNRFPYYELDFGFGSPVCSMRNANAAWDSLFVFLPSSQSPENFTAMLHS
jgi:hypothetical protein